MQKLSSILLGCLCLCSLCSLHSLQSGMPACNIDTIVLAQLEYFFPKEVQHGANIQVERHRRNVNKTFFSHPYQIAVPRFGHWAFHPRFHSLWLCSEGWFGRGALIWLDLLMSIWAGITRPRQQLFRVQLACYSYEKKRKKNSQLDPKEKKRAVLLRRFQRSTSSSGRSVWWDLRSPSLSVTL